MKKKKFDRMYKKELKKAIREQKEQKNADKQGDSE
jgi:hypothetical protein